MYKLDVRVDAKEAAAIERRRNLEQQRQARIFDARERTIGVDAGSLTQQVQEKRQREGVEKQRHNAFAAEMKRNDKIGELLHQRQERDIRELNKSLNEFRKEHQRDIDRREFDLYDPDSKQKDLPARVSDEDPRVTQSGMQVFGGEDLMYEKRRSLQQEQMREWSSQQMAEKERLLSEERHSQRLYDLKACELDQRAVELAMAEDETRRAINVATKDYNLALAKEKCAQQQQEKAQEQDDNYTELSNGIHGDLLTENPEVAQSGFGQHRVIPDRWKGMSPRQVQQIRETQERQEEEKKALLTAEKQREAEWDRRRVVEARAGLVLDSQLQKSKKQLTMKLAEENRQLAAEQRATQDYLKKEVYTNVPSGSYFAQFNTSSR